MPDGILLEYVPILTLILVGLGIGGVALIAPQLLAPKRPSRRKQLPYESGMIPIGPAQRRFPVKFYLIALLFILFDIEIIFFYPWALQVRSLKTLALVEMGLFVLILLIGYIYAWRKGAFEWER
ncbi:MAG: NADH-quinone oxidoreductase subunit A [Thermoflexus sp.]|nr:NADH-quinone oxidoreductase subunit A [Thermoflexus sp.]MCS6965032.1 NADH-quinone oxidoreductase subunit A [Thermoflexus sp.]MCS7351760.1 NADH-quinone oxidoreductase subunit A [Thermoflexus sp.]MCX7691093.1 NADH-quinone oxidoreductase subunit A [Thermoflexus sp.]